MKKYKKDIDRDTDDRKIEQNDRSIKTEIVMKKYKKKYRKRYNRTIDQQKQKLV